MKKVKHIDTDKLFDVLDESIYFWFIVSVNGGRPFWAAKQTYKLV